MLFYFDIKDGVPVRDRVGREFVHVSEAIEFSKEYARTLRSGGMHRGARILVLNENGFMIHEEPIRLPAE